MTASLTDSVADALAGFGVAEQDAAAIGRWLQEMIDDARRGWAVDDFHRAAIVEHLRHQACSRSTATALAALDRIEQEAFGGARVPSTHVRERFFPMQATVWDREIYRHWCHDCQRWTESDARTNLLGPLWCECGTRLVP